MIVRLARSLQRITQLAVLAFSLCVMLGLTQPAWATPSPEVVIKGDAGPTLTESELKEKRARRREEQSRASAVSQPMDEDADSLGEVLSDKLNLDEIVEDNEIFGQTPEREEYGISK